MKTLEEARAYAKQERSVETQEIWEAILAIHESLVLMGSAGLPERFVSIAGANLVRAGAADSGNFTDAQLASMATADGVRVWSADMGMVFKDEVVIGPDQEAYICLKQHKSKSMWAPGSEKGDRLFRILRKESEEEGTYLDFVWGEHVPYGAVRRDPVDDQLYTPVNEAGATLYEPNYPHLVPSEYKIYEEQTSEPGTEPESFPDWNDLEKNHRFEVGDHFIYDGVEYEVLRSFKNNGNFAPPACIDDYYRVVS